MEQWAELRREHFVRGVSIKEIVRRTGLSRNTVRAALRSPSAPGYERAPGGSKLDPFKDEIHRLLKGDPGMPGQRIRELIAPLGFEGGKTIVDDYLREVRPLFAAPRTFQGTIYQPGEICQFDLWEPKDEVPVGHGQTRRAWVVVACLGYSRAGAGTLVFSKQTPELLFGIRRCLWSLGALPETLVWDRQSGLHASAGRPTTEFAGFCGALKVDWHFCEPRDPQAKGGVERLQDFMERSSSRGGASRTSLISSSSSIGGPGAASRTLDSPRSAPMRGRARPHHAFGASQPSGVWGIPPLRGSCLIARAGVPAMIQPPGKSPPVTTDPAPTTAFAPIRVPRVITAPAATKVLRPIDTGSTRSGCRRKCVSEPSTVFSESTIVTRSAMPTKSASSMRSVQWSTSPWDTETSSPRRSCPSDLRIA